MKPMASPRRRKTLSTLILTMAFSMACNAGQTSEKLGLVDFPSSCTELGNTTFNKGLALLHHMMYLQAEEVFAQGITQDKECAMLYWGVAMANFHPLWPGVPSNEEFARGKAAAAELKKQFKISAIERSLIDTVLAFYDPANDGFRGSVAKWAKAQSEAFAANPENIDVAALHALAQLSIAPRGDETFKHQRVVGSLLDTWHDKNPTHPGIIHYAIHAYDNPKLARRGLKHARTYDRIAPNVPHALHMPSHIFVRLGLWQESIDWNARSASAAKAKQHNGMMPNHYAHAMDYGIYSQLQLGNFSTAERMLEELLMVKNHQPNFGSAYALAASPVRVLLEQEKWSEVEQLPEIPHSAIRWEHFPQCVSMLWFGKGIGAIRAGDSLSATKALDKLTELHATLIANKQDYWAKLTEAQILSIEAWRELESGNVELAVQLQTKAADIEDTAGKSPVTPGHVLPARELLGDLYRKVGQDQLAQKAYANVLSHSPNRRRSVAQIGE